MNVLWFTVQILSTLVLIVGIVESMRAGEKFPRWVHTLAVALSVCGVVMLIVCVINGPVGAGFIAACLFVPAASAYFGWLWFGGPLLTETRRPSDPPI